ncbi:hypothetical protein GCM10010389_05690 [Streptomyces echinoruber]|uniref:Uncharacterized protein n=1 Tax=Streptomyces echinoruber TaxID=68898 RepID=A0A918V5D4_9ACTN|nr:hypothetical protein GCM10010389_05690 [Streptomyces echinoruber]
MPKTRSALGLLDRPAALEEHGWSSCHGRRSLRRSPGPKAPNLISPAAVEDADVQGEAVRVSRSPSAAAAKFTLPHVSAAAAPATNRARPPIPVSSSAPSATFTRECELPREGRKSAGSGRAGRRCASGVSVGFRCDIPRTGITRHPGFEEPCRNLGRHPAGQALDRDRRERPERSWAYGRAEEHAEEVRRDSAGGGAF